MILIYTFEILNVFIVFLNHKINKPIKLNGI